MTKYSGPVVTTDSVLLRNREGVLEVLLHERRLEPFAGALALPGVYVQSGESINEATRRSLANKGGVILAPSSESRVVDVYDAIDRDPRGHALSVVTLSFIAGSSDAETTEGVVWVPLREVNSNGLAFDHDDILDSVYQWMLSRLWSDKFVLFGLLLGQPLTTATIKRALVAMGQTGETTNMVSRRLVNSGMIAPVDGATAPHDGPGRPSKVWAWSS